MTIMTKISLMAVNNASDHRDGDDHTDDKSYADGLLRMVAVMVVMMIMMMTVKTMLLRKEGLWMLMAVIAVEMKKDKIDLGGHVSFHPLNHWFYACLLQGWVCLVLLRQLDPNSGLIKPQSSNPPLDGPIHMFF